ncbi:dihydroneopterin aldolase [Candidatus Contubernalis alkalaceticus]|nr:dihydroneopterin aldolase [Candidatus Contubernalis alkalaceticus]
MGKIILNELSFYGYHGVLPTERIQGQKFLVSLEIYMDFSKPSETDGLKDTICYVELYEKIKRLVQRERYNILETLAEKIAEMVLEDPLAVEVVVLIKKPWAPIPGNLDYVGVEIRRGGLSG